MRSLNGTKLGLGRPSPSVTRHFLRHCVRSPPHAALYLACKFVRLASDSRDGFLCKNHEMAMRDRGREPTEIPPRPRRRCRVWPDKSVALARSAPPVQKLPNSQGMHCPDGWRKGGERTRQLVSCPLRGLARTPFFTNSITSLHLLLPQPLIAVLSRDR